MKNFENKSTAKRGTPAMVIIASLIIIPLLYLVYFSSTGKASGTHSKGDTLSANNAAGDSLKIKLQKAIDLATTNPNEPNCINLSLLYYNAGQYKECVLASQKALEYNPKCYAAYNNMCTAFNSLSMWAEGIDAGKKALEIMPGDQLATNNLKASTDGKAKEDKAIADGEALVKMSPSETNYSNLGYTYYLARKYEIAITCYKKVLTYNKKNIIAYNNICSAYNELGKYKEAMENCEAALKIDSTYALSKNNLKESKAALKK